MDPVTQLTSAVIESADALAGDGRRQRPTLDRPPRLHAALQP